MNGTVTKTLHTLEGRMAHVTLADGTSLFGCQVVSAGRGTVRTVWLFDGYGDRFVDLDEVVAVRADSSRSS